MPWERYEHTEVNFKTVGDILNELDHIDAAMRQLFDDCNRDNEIAQLLRNYRRVLRKLPIKEV